MTQKNKLTNKNVKLYMAFMKMAGNKTAAERLGSMFNYVDVKSPIRFTQWIFTNNATFYFVVKTCGSLSAFT